MTARAAGSRKTRRPRRVSERPSERLSHRRPSDGGERGSAIALPLILTILSYKRLGVLFWRLGGWGVVATRRAAARSAAQRKKTRKTTQNQRRKRGRRFENQRRNQRRRFNFSSFFVQKPFQIQFDVVPSILLVVGSRCDLRPTIARRLHVERVGQRNVGRGFI